MILVKRTTNAMMQRILIARIIFDLLLKNMQSKDSYFPLLFQTPAIAAVSAFPQIRAVYFRSLSCLYFPRAYDRGCPHT